MRRGRVGQAESVDGFRTLGLDERRPLGGVGGLVGHNAACEVLRDRRR